MSEMPTSPLIYAELLANIGQISVIAQLSTPSSLDAKTQVEVSVDRRHLRICHDGVITSLNLPGEAAAGFILPKLPLGTSEISWRIPLRAKALPPPTFDHNTEAVAPWPSNELSSATKIACRKCGAGLVTLGAITVWRDLPSENWAEMMDFWHCHKPSDHKIMGQKTQTQDTLAQRGYGANNSFVARPGIGLVDLTYFLLAEGDCQGIKNSAPVQNGSTSATTSSLLCENCQSYLGVFDRISQGYRIYKWSLELTNLQHAQLSTPPLSHFLTAYLLALISAQAVHRFVVHAPLSASPILHIWVFAPRLAISLSTSPEAPAPVPAMKIFYTAATPAEMAALLENASFTVEEVRLPPDVVDEFSTLLTQSTARLPTSARKFGHWHVGFLERFIQ